jgi:hypothetical protein
MVSARVATLCGIIVIIRKEALFGTGREQGTLKDPTSAVRDQCEPPFQAGVPLQPRVSVALGSASPRALDALTGAVAALPAFLAASTLERTLTAIGDAPAPDALGATRGRFAGGWRDALAGVVAGLLMFLAGAAGAAALVVATRLAVARRGAGWRDTDTAAAL